MKKVLAALSLLLALGLAPAHATDANGNRTARASYAQAPSNPFNVITCGIWILPARCTAAERIVGTTLVGAGLGAGIGALVGAGGYSIGGSFLAAKGTAAMAWTSGVIGAGTGFVGGTFVSGYMDR